MGPSGYRLEFFSHGLVAAPADAVHWGDAPAQRTVYPPADPVVDAVLLFSDGRFDPPDGGPPTYPVIDPLLEDVPDSAVTQLQLDPGSISIDVTGDDTHRVLTLSEDGVADETIPVRPGTQAIRRPLRPGVVQVAVRLSPGDAWPENDELAAFVAPAAQPEQWWIATSPTPSSAWRALAPGALPTDPAAYLAASVLVLDNIDADALDLSQQRLLLQYVRDLGGSLLILGGDHAFAAGN